jgi:hypothetical protein
VETEANELFNVSPNGTGKAPQLCAETSLEHELDSLRVVGGDARKSGFDATYTEFVEFASDLELLLGRQDDTDGLFAVAKSRVVETYG